MSAASLRDKLLLALAQGDGQPWQTIAEATPHTAEMMYGSQADAVLAVLGEVTVTEERGFTAEAALRRTLVPGRDEGEWVKAE